LRVLLINPRIRLPIDTRTTPHLGLAYLGAVSERRGDTVQVFDMDVEDVPLAAALREFSPHIVGITANTPQVRQAWQAAQEVKAVLPHVPVVIGGPHVSALPEESALRPEIDVVVRGEGEATWLELCAAVEQANFEFRTANFEIRGISYKTADGRVVHNPPRPPIADLDSLPWPAYHLFKMDRYTSLQPATDRVAGARSFSMMTSRGCPYRCVFCSQSIMPEKWRARSPQNVLQEWRHLVADLGAQEIGLLDDSANIQRQRLLELCDLLIAEKLNHVPWIMVNGIRANLADDELLGRMKAAGCKRTAFGVETGDPEIMKSINKHLTLDQVRAAFRAAKKVGLETIGFFIIGLPGDNERTMEATIRFAIELDPFIANFSMMTPYPGTKVWEQVHTQGGRMLVQDWQDYVFFEGKARYEMGETTAELQERKWQEAYRRFYLRPSRVWRTLTRKETWLNFPRTSRMALRVIFPQPTGGDCRL
jgi:radical SAM superfamily enzyme YgiQ (UPF0313 family)